MIFFDIHILFTPTKITGHYKIVKKMYQQRLATEVAVCDGRFETSRC